MVIPLPAAVRSGRPLAFNWSVRNLSDPPNSYQGVLLQVAKDNHRYAHPFEWTWTNQKMRQWAAPDEVLLIDDDAGWIRSDPLSQWVPIAAWDSGSESELL